MVIASHSTDVDNSTQLEPSESVEEPPIRKKPDLSHPYIDEKNSDFASLSKEEVCRFAHTIDVNHISSRLGVDIKHGFGVDEAAVRLAQDGPNKIKDTERVSIWQILLRQVSNSLTVVLLITMVLSFSLHDYIEGAVITTVILLNIIVGFVQDYRAEQTILSLQALSAPNCTVLRSGQTQVVKAETLVVGDVVLLSAGAVVPADLRLFDGMNLSTDEALLTGESLPIAKYPAKELTVKDMPIGDRSNMVYSASLVTRGRGAGIVVATAMLTEVGKIATLLGDKRNVTSKENAVVRIYRSAVRRGRHALGLVGSPLQVKLSKFALFLFALAILLAIIVFSANLWNVEDEILIYAICCAVAVIPESLIAVLTLTIAVGTKAMARSNIIIRKLTSLEAVGGVTNICSDKTGTLTQGKMIVRKAMIAGGETLMVHNTTNPFDPTSGTVQSDTSHNEKPDLDQNQPLTRFLDVVSLCNLSTVQHLEDGLPVPTLSGHTPAPTKWTAIGEPTEIALQVFAMRFHHGRSDAMLKHGLDLLNEFPFDSEIKRMSMAYSRPNSTSIDIFTKGATETLVPILNCAEEERQRISSEAEDMAGEGLRVLCLAYKSISTEEQDQLSNRSLVESDLSFVGLIGLYDPPRAETAAAVRMCQTAGITVHMLTGDHIRTAATIAAEVGIVDQSMMGSPFATARRTVMTAAEFDKLSESEVDQMEHLPLVIARCSPSTKVRMVQALHRRKAFCIMTGDGINDSPALKMADVGIAMGLNGSDVAKQAADMVLADDDFASIVRAVQEGRRLFDNIQKFLLHLLTSNIAQVILLMIALAFKDANNNPVFPLSPLEILWANLVTSSPLALGLGLEPASVDVMTRPPKRSGVFTKELIIDKMVYGTTMGSLCLVGFVSIVYGMGGGKLGQDCNQDYNETCNVVFEARATVFAILSFTLLVTAWEVKDFDRSLFNMGLIDFQSAVRTPKFLSVFPTVYQNRFLFWACVSGFAIVFPLIYLPEVNIRVFKHLGITKEWAVVFGCLVMYVLVIEMWKMTKRWRKRKAQREMGLDSGISTPKDSSSV